MAKLLLALCLAPAAARTPQPARALRRAQVVAGGAAVAESKSSVTTSALNLAKNIVGSGVLALPAGVAACSTAKGACKAALCIASSPRRAPRRRFLGGRRETASSEDEPNRPRRGRDRAASNGLVSRRLGR